MYSIGRLTTVLHTKEQPMRFPQRNTLAAAFILFITAFSFNWSVSTHKDTANTVAVPKIEAAIPKEDFYASNLAAMNAARPCDRIRVNYPANATGASHWMKIDNGVVSTRQLLEFPQSDTHVDGIGFQNHIGGVGEAASVFGGLDIPKTARDLSDHGGKISFTPLRHCYVDSGGIVNVTW